MWRYFHGYLEMGLLSGEKIWISIVVWIWICCVDGCFGGCLGVGWIVG
jgi:hypothetical protein